MSDVGSDFGLAEGMDGELLYEEETMLADPRCIRGNRWLSENPVAVEENYDANVAV